MKPLKHLILALFVFFGFSQTPTAAETIIMACDVTTIKYDTNSVIRKEKIAIFKGEFGTFSSEVHFRWKGEWIEFCGERPNKVSGIREVTYLDKAARCVRKDYVSKLSNGVLEMQNTDIVFDFAFARADGIVAISRKNKNAVFEAIGERKWHDCEIQK